MTRPHSGDTAPVVHAVSAMIAGVFVQVAQVRDRLAACLRIFADDGVTRRDVASVQPQVLAELHAAGGLWRGAGVALAPGLLMDARLWIDWLVIDSAGSTRPTAFNFDEDSLDFYDYTAAEWFAAPRDGDRRSLVGPYVDFNGLNDYIVTATTPVDIGGRFIGVAGADLSVDEIERCVLGANKHVGAKLALVNSSHRIVASTSARHTVGSLLQPQHVTSSRPAPQRVAIPDSAWSVVRLE